MELVKSFTISRALWSRGTVDCDANARLNRMFGELPDYKQALLVVGTDQKCCAGTFASACGVEDSWLANVSRLDSFGPTYLSEIFYEFGKVGLGGEYLSWWDQGILGDLAINLIYKVNDQTGLTNEEREATLTRLWRQYCGVSVTFVD